MSSSLPDDERIEALAQAVARLRTEHEEMNRRLARKVECADRLVRSSPSIGPCQRSFESDRRSRKETRRASDPGAKSTWQSIESTKVEFASRKRQSLTLVP